MKDATVYALCVAALATAAIAIAGGALATTSDAPAAVVVQVEAATAQVTAQNSAMNIPF